MKNLGSSGTVSEQPNRDILPRPGQGRRSTLRAPRLRRHLSWMLFLALACGESGTDPVTGGPATIRLDPSSLDLWVQDTARVTATVLDELGNTLSGFSVEWSSDDPTVATVAGGLVRGVSVGSSTRVRASVADVSSSVPVSVDSPPMAALLVVQDSISLVRGDGRALDWFALDARNDTLRAPDVVWSSASTSIVEVTATGFLRGVGEGKTLVTVRGNDLADTVSVEVLPRPSGLAPADSSVLTRALLTMSAEPLWPYPPVVDSAMQVLWSVDYDAADWEGFFRGYLSRHRWTWDLWWNWFGYPLFSWGPEERRRAVQAGLYPAAYDEVRWSIEAHGRSLGAAFAGDPSFEAHVLLNARFTSAVIGSLGLMDDRHDRVYLDQLALLQAFPWLFGKQALSGDDRELGVLRLHTWVHLTEAARLTGRPYRELGDQLGLSGSYLDIFSAWGVLLLDNSRLDQVQLDVLSSFLDALPEEYATRTAISVWDQWAGRDLGPESLFGAVNIFDIAVGAAPANPFPSDIEPRTSDTFTEVLAHELTHLIDALDVSPDVEWGARRDELIARAGSEDLNYLRSMVGGDFFQDAPQEFLASIANQWFTDSEHTLRLGRSRFASSRAEPLNQALFFAEIMSQRGEFTYFYRHDTTGSIEVEAVPVVRDANRFISQLEVGDSVHYFDRDIEGNVTSTWSTANH